MAPKKRKDKRLKQAWWFFASTTVSLLILALIYVYQKGTSDIESREAKRSQHVTVVRKMLAQALGPSLWQNHLDTEVELPFPRYDVDENPMPPKDGESPVAKVKIEYTIDQSLQKEAEKLLASFKPDYGALVMMDAATGKIVAMASYQRSDPNAPNLALRSTYPAASVFKIITAGAAVDRYEVSPDTLIMFNGGNHTLYKRNVMNANVNRWTRNMTLREAFARSINTVFARLSFERLQPQDLKEYAIRFGFNKSVTTDLPMDPGFVDIPDEKNFHLAEIASGYNKITKMSPVQGAMIASSVADDGVMHTPYIVDRVLSESGEVLFQSEPQISGVTLSRAGAEKLKELMEATVTQGTGRKSFRGLVRDKKFEELELGGKTGSLHGDDPKGKVDWFVGYAVGEKSRMAIAAITVNKEKWTVKSTYLAQSLFRKHFGNQFSKNNEKFLSATSEAETKISE